MKLVRPFDVKLLLAFLILNLSALSASAQGFIWAQEFTSVTYSGSRSIYACVTDADNNNYSVGAFHGTTDLDPSIGIQDVTPGGYYDMFIVKNDASGNLLWMKHIVGIDADTSKCFGNGIALDAAGNIYIGGMYSDTVDFDPGPGVQLLSTYSNSYSSFVLKLNPSGDFIWVKNMGAQTALTNISIGKLKIDAADNIFFTCGFVSNTPCIIDVDPGPGVYNIPCQTNVDFLIEKLDSAGNFIWAKAFSAPDYQGVSAMAFDEISNIYITGKLKGTVDFDPALNTATLTSVGGYDIFIAKYDSAGNYLWAGTIASSYDDDAYDIVTDTFGNVIVTGQKGFGTTDFDLGPGVYNWTTNSSNRFFLKLYNDGSFGWLKTNYGLTGTTITTDGIGNIYSTGSRFVRKIDSAGNAIWLKTFNEGLNSAAITLDHANDIYLTGNVNASPYDFDPGPGESIVEGTGGGFIVKLCGESLSFAITAGSDTLCGGGDFAELSSPFIPGATYTWTLNGWPIPGSNSNVLTTTETGIFEVFVDGGCPSASGAPIYIYNCDGNLTGDVASTMKAAGVEVYPNPFDDVITVKGLDAGDRVELIDITGRVLHSWHSTASTETFTISELVPGHYVLRVVDEQGVGRVNVSVVKR